MVRCLQDSNAYAMPSWTVSTTSAITVGATFAYQAFSYGWLVGELVRRITGDTLGTFFRREIAEPLGLDTWIGTPLSIQARVARCLPEPPRELSPEAAALEART